MTDWSGWMAVLRQGQAAAGEAGLGSVEQGASLAAVEPAGVVAGAVVGLPVGGAVSELRWPAKTEGTGVPTVTAEEGRLVAAEGHLVRLAAVAKHPAAVEGLLVAVAEHPAAAVAAGEERLVAGSDGARWLLLPAAGCGGSAVDARGP